ncbi:hypothetical protein HDU76_003986 [Blyttiomyces sp. JEL0837]|nr:hypothetical protein HDU76_003986 [Blyttiomyces sp. JEL0837]
MKNITHDLANLLILILSASTLSISPTTASTIQIQRAPLDTPYHFTRAREWSIARVQSSILRGTSSSNLAPAILNARDQTVERLTTIDGINLHTPGIIPTTKKSEAPSTGPGTQFTTNPSSIPLTVDVTGGAHYTANVTIGTNQVFGLLLDTGSSDLWSRGANCVVPTSINVQDDGSCNGRKVNLNDPKIVPVQRGGDTFGLKTMYGPANNPNSELLLQVYVAQVTLAGVSATTNIGVSVAEIGFPFDGIFGLGYDSNSVISTSLKQLGDPNYNANFISAMPPSEPRIFGFYFSDFGNGDEGEFTLGGFDTSRVLGNVTYLSVTQQLFWQFDFTGAMWSLGSGVGGSLSGAVTAAIVDTGTPLILLDNDVAHSINTALGGLFDPQVNQYQLDCKKLSSLPTLHVTIQNQAYELPPTFYAQKFGDGFGNYACYSLLSGGATANQMAIFGIPFLRQYYSVFDQGRNLIGFGLAKHGASGVASAGPGVAGSSSSTSTGGVKSGDGGVVSGGQTVATGGGGRDKSGALRNLSLSKKPILFVLATLFILS